MVRRRLCNIFLPHVGTNDICRNRGTVNILFYWWIALSTIGYAPTVQPNLCFRSSLAGYLAMETELRSSWSLSSSHGLFQTPTMTEVPMVQSSDVNAHPSDATKQNTNVDVIASSRPARTIALHCFTCRKRGHI